MGQLHPSAYRYLCELLLLWNLLCAERSISIKPITNVSDEILDLPAQTYIYMYVSKKNAARRCGVEAGCVAVSSKQAGESNWQLIIFSPATLQLFHVTRQCAVITQHCVYSMKARNFLHMGVKSGESGHACVRKFADSEIDYPNHKYVQFTKESTPID